MCHCDAVVVTGIIVVANLFSLVSKKHRRKECESRQGDWSLQTYRAQDQGIASCKFNLSETKWNGK